MKFTDQQINNWWLYEEVRLSGEFNIFDGRARAGTAMTKEEWIFNITHYDALRKAAESMEGTEA